MSTGTFSPGAEEGKNAQPSMKSDSKMEGKSGQERSSAVLVGIMLYGAV